MNQTALVIGGTGFLGTAIVRVLRDAGWTVTCLARGQRDNANADVPLLTADRSVPGELMTAVQGLEFDLVVDCAAFQEPHAAEAIETFAGRVGLYVFISTDFVYAAAPDAHYPLREDAPKQYDLPYGKGKLDCEAALVRAWEERQFPATILRPPHIVGAGRALGCDPLVMREAGLLDDIRAGRELPLLAEGQLLIQPVWNREVGHCIVHLATAPGGECGCGEIFNCTGPNAVTTLRYYEIIAGYLEVPLRTRSVSLREFREQHPDKAHMARHRIYDLNRLRVLTGYTPHLRLEEAIGETASWLDGNSKV